MRRGGIVPAVDTILQIVKFVQFSWWQMIGHMRIVECDPQEPGIVIILFLNPCDRVVDNGARSIFLFCTDNLSVDVFDVLKKIGTRGPDIDLKC